MPLRHRSQMFADAGGTAFRMNAPDRSIAAGAFREARMAWKRFAAAFTARGLRRPRHAKLVMASQWMTFFDRLPCSIN